MSETLALTAVGALYAAFLTTGWLAARRRGSLTTAGFIIAGATAVFALIMIRNFALFALCMLPVVLKNISDINYHPNFRFPFRGLIVVWCILFGIAIVSGQFYGQYGAPYRQFGFVVPSGFDDPIAFYRAHNIHGPIFNNFDIGSYLIWKLPEEPVFVDGRPEAYPASFFSDVYIPMQESADAWNTYSKKYGINAIVWDYGDITPWSQTFVARITHDPAWVSVYNAHSVMILVRRTR